MDDKVKKVLDNSKQAMQRALEHYEQELLKIRAGKANPVILDSIKVDYYGSPMPLKQIANVTVLDTRTLMIQPYEKSMIAPIEKSIMDANIGLNPQNDGIVIRISIPMLTEERRKQLVKQAKEVAEAAKVGVRNARRDHNEQLKKLPKEGVAEDMVKLGESEVQKMTDSYSTKIDSLLSHKEAEIMTV